MEIFRNGYIEYCRSLGVDSKDIHASKGHTLYIASFIGFIEKIYSSYLPMTPIVLDFEIYNARGMWLAVTGWPEDKSVRWPEQHLELERFYVENIANESKLLPKRVADCLWQAFNREESSVFDSQGNFISS